MSRPRHTHGPHVQPAQAPGGQGQMGTPAGFYNRLAGSYDRMTDFAARVRNAGRLISAIGGRFAPRPAVGVDLGCGTGAYACALAAAGFRASGLDLAEEMVAQARQNAARLALDVRFECGALETLPSPFSPGAAGLVLCLGNTLPHLTDPDDLTQALGGMAALLAPDGLAVIQTLNYDRILARQERIVSVDRDAGATFVRFYDFLPDGLVRFNLLRSTWNGREGRPEPLLSVVLRAYRHSDLEQAAAQAGMTVVFKAGDTAMTPYDPAAADTVLLVLRPARPGSH